jgi:uncharacterized protein
MDRSSPVLDQLIEAIVEAAHPIEIVLFGSAARGEARADSDIDLLIVMPEGTHRRHTAERLYRALARFAISVDLVVATPGDLERYRHTPGLIYKTIAQEGRSLYAA